MSSILGLCAPRLPIATWRHRATRSLCPDDFIGPVPGWLLVTYEGSLPGSLYSRQDAPRSQPRRSTLRLVCGSQFRSLVLCRETGGGSQNMTVPEPNWPCAAGDGGVPVDVLNWGCVHSGMCQGMCTASYGRTRWELLLGSAAIEQGGWWRISAGRPIRAPSPTNEHRPFFFFCPFFFSSCLSVVGGNSRAGAKMWSAGKFRHVTAKKCADSSAGSGDGPEWPATKQPFFPHKSAAPTRR